MNGGFRFFREQAVLAELDDENRTRLRRLILLETVDSTNLELRRWPTDEQHGGVVLSDQQSAGRGRRGRPWHSPPGSNIYLSLGWHFPQSGEVLQQLPLAVAVSVARAVRRAGVRTAGIKWPNDILIDGRKLAGVLVELSAAGVDRARAVIGVGVNVRMPAGAASQPEIDQPWTDVCTQLSTAAGSDFRDRLCGIILDELLDGMARFAATGFGSFRTGWAELDLLEGREVAITAGPGTIIGTARGVSDRGGLNVAVADISGGVSVREFFAGEVQVRSVKP
ncbi:MAG TPA: biotin--[acetyl-CoA-carboxylase] ligase [Xanthomonadales bacterium]|nr:biotin--[acetyl-CoA-carboxylase] ligase [Xanthomonadales bacterium]